MKKIVKSILIVMLLVISTGLFAQQRARVLVTDPSEGYSYQATLRLYYNNGFTTTLIYTSPAYPATLNVPLYIPFTVPYDTDLNRYRVSVTVNKNQGLAYATGWSAWFNTPYWEAYDIKVNVAF